MHYKTVWSIGASLLMLMILVTGCGAAEPERPTVQVGSKNFTEQFIVGEMYALVLEEAGFPVERRLNIGETPIAHQALLESEIDLYPEYTGTGLLTVLKMEQMTDEQEVYDTVAAEYQQRFNLTWLDAAPMNNTQAIAMTRPTAEQMNILTVSDFVRNASRLRVAGPAEFLEREDGYLGLQELYGTFEFAEYVPIDPGLRYSALADGEVDAVVAFSTDGQIEQYDLMVLDDDRNFWPPYQLAPVLRTPLVDAYPEVRQTLNLLSPLLTDEVMQSLNNEVSGNGRPPGDVARMFLLQKGLIEEEAEE